MNIPKKIHLFWFGRGEKSEVIQKCIESWCKYAPDYEIIEWNEDNFDVNFCERSRQAYEQKKWAFVADVARLKVIYEQGGIYLDTDVLMKQPFHDFMIETQDALPFFCSIMNVLLAQATGLVQFLVLKLSDIFCAIMKVWSLS